MSSAHYVDSASCQKYHAAIDERWRKTPMANVMRDPREHADAIIPDLKTDSVLSPVMRSGALYVHVAPRWQCCSSPCLQASHV
jgi:hypothetical protein